MRRTAIVTTVLTALAIGVPAAQGGSSITKLPACPNSYLLYGPGVSRSDFRAALACLINGARKAEHLPALKRSALLEGVGQRQSDTFAATGRGSHGKSVTDIGKRDAKAGYKPAAYNEGFSVLDPGATPYGFLADMVAHGGVPCTEIFDPRFRDLGIGVSVGMHGVADTLALEFGLRAGAKQPSTNTKASTSCGHKVPKPLVSGAEIEGVGTPAASATGVTIKLKCEAKVSCVLSAKLSLPDAHAVSPAQSLKIAAGSTQAIVFPFDPAAIQTELAGSSAHVSLTITVTAPAQYSDTLSAPLMG